MERIRNDEWKNDLSLFEEIKNKLASGYKRKEILTCIQQAFPMYAWSSRTLDRRIEFFNLSRKNNQSTLEEATAAIEVELKGPGALLGYRALHQKLRQLHTVNVPRDVVYAIMGCLDPEGLANRRPGIKKKKAKGVFWSKGPNFVHSFDGHDKMMGFQNWTFPIALYGCMDTCSRKVLWVKVWTSNHNPVYPGLWYLQHIKKTKTIPRYIRIDKGTETVEMTAIHAYLTGTILNLTEDEAANSVIFGPSTSNQIERWWKELHERLEHFYKPILLQLKNDGHYIPDDQLHRDFLAFLVIPLFQNEVDVFVNLWNDHRIRKQKGVELPDGIPNYIHDFPEQFGLEECGFRVTDDQINEVQSQADIASETDDFLSVDMRRFCTRVIPHDVTHTEIRSSFIRLKREWSNSQPLSAMPILN